MDQSRREVRTDGIRAPHKPHQLQEYVGKYGSLTVFLILQSLTLLFKPSVEAIHLQHLFSHRFEKDT
jgi:hypothetical protein